MFCFRFVRLTQKRRQDVRSVQVEILIRAIKIGWHRRNKIGVVLESVSLTKFDPGDLGNRVGFVGWLEWASQQSALRNRLRRMLGINAGTAEKKQFARAVLVRRRNDIGLDPQIISQKLHRKIVVGFNPSHFGGRKEDDLGFLFAEKI